LHKGLRFLNIGLNHDNLKWKLMLTNIQTNKILEKMNITRNGDIEYQRKKKKEYNGGC